MCCEIRGGQLLGKCTAACFKEILTCDETAWRVTSHSIYLYFAWFKICIQPKIWPCMYSVKIVLCEKNWSHSNSSFFSNVAWVWPRGDFFCKSILLAVFLALLHSLPLSPEFDLNCLEFFLKQDFVALILSLQFLLPLQHFLRPAISLTSFPFFDATFSYKRMYGLGYNFGIFGTAK